jgi:hypothetical protein
MHPNDMLLIGIAVLFLLVCAMYAVGRVREARRRGATLRVIPHVEQDRAVSLADLIATAEKDKLFKRDLDRARNPGRAFLDEIEEDAKEDAARRLAAKLRRAKATQHEADIAAAVAPKAPAPNA